MSTKKVDRPAPEGHTPSLHNYKKYGCRCTGCCAASKRQRQKDNESRRLRENRAKPPGLLPDWELQMLRRAVGLIP